MTEQEIRLAAAAEAIKAGGGPTELACRIEERTGHTISPDRVRKWGKIGVPPQWVLVVEQETGVSRHRLHPAIYPPQIAV